jgi:2-dehydro-3-deoxyphosphogluconate aldolase/(4S)-4-hydroxy-2-oxoglutarate aldolase
VIVKGTAENVARLLEERRVIGIARLRNADLVVEAAVVAAAHGLSAIEVPFTVPRAAYAIAALRERLEPDVVIGAGTIRTKSELQDALRAGAQFLVAPGLNPELVKAAQSAGVLMVPGVYTASEVELALSLGLQLLKLFPAVPAGPEYLAALRQPFPEVRFVPTGGVGPENAAPFFLAGAAALGMGSSIFPQRRIESEGPKIVAELAEAALRAASPGA